MLKDPACAYSAAAEVNCRQVCATRLLCRFSHAISDRVNRWLTSEIGGFDIGEAVEPMTEGVPPEDFEGLPMVLL